MKTFLVLFALSLLFVAGPTAAFEIEVLYLSGDEPPGIPGETFDTFSEPVVNEAGQVAFGARLSSGTSNRRGVWGPKGAGGTQLIARAGDVAPGTFGQLFADNEMTNVQMNDLGEVLFKGKVAIKDAAWRWSIASNALALVAFEGIQIPGAPVGAFYTRFIADDLVLTDAGVFGCHSSAFPLKERYLLGPSGDAVQQWLDIGAALPGAPGETVKYTCDVRESSTNFAGEYAFKVDLISNVNAVLVVDDTETYSLAALGGSFPGAPSAPTGVTATSLNRGGDVAMQAAGPGGYAFYGPDGLGGMTSWVQNGTPIADIPGSSYSMAGVDEMMLSDGGHLFFASRITNSPVAGVDYGAFRRKTDGTVELIYREGDPVPSSAGLFAENVLPPGNADGDAIVLAGGNAFVSRPGAALELVLQSGQLLEVAPGDFRTVSAVFGHHTTTQHHLNRRGLNNDGDAVFWLRFTDGDESIVKVNINAPVVPALPIGGWLLGTVLLGASGVGLVRKRTAR